MFFLPFLLLLTISSSDATFEVPDINSFMPNILEMVPINGQLRFNDQVINFGDPNATPIPSDNTEPNVVTESTLTQAFDSPQPQPIANNLPQTSNFDSRTSNFQSFTVNTVPQNLNAPTFTAPLPQNPSNFDTRIPSLDSSISNPNLQNQNLLPNIGSTEVGSTFARNANSNFRDEFSEPSGSTHFPLGFPTNNNQLNRATGPLSSRSNLNPTESPLVVMPLVVSPERLLQTNNPFMARDSNPTPLAALMASESKVDERHNFRRFEPKPIVLSLPVNGRQNQSPLNTGPHDSVQVIRQTSFLLPPPTVTQIKAESTFGDSKDKSSLERHLPPVLTKQKELNLTVSQLTEPIKNSVIPFKFDDSVFRPQRIPTFAELDKTLADIKRSQQTITNSQIVSPNKSI